jgi:NifU-like protein involved in Fe-S cluster formation
MSRLALPLLLATLLAGCGIDAATSAATAAKLKAREAEQAQAMKHSIEQQLDAAQKQEDQRRKEMDAATR